jgi:hypothetical protein
MELIARTLRYLANRYLADPDRSNQSIARANAAQACATLRNRRNERDDVDAYLRVRRRDPDIVVIRTLRTSAMRSGRPSGED